MRRSILLVSLALLVTGGVPGAVAQEPYPTRPITLVNPFPPGGLADLTGRPLAAALERVLKQPVVVSNKAGAAGAVGMQSVAIAKPDGYTLLISVPSITLLPEVDAIFGRPPTFSRDQFAGIARLNADPVIVVVNAEAPWKNLKDLIDDAKRRPGEITFSSSGPYGASHVPTEMLLQAAGGLRMRHLPTTGGGPAMTAVLGRHVQFWCSPPAVAAPHLKSGKVRAFASTGAARHPSFPDVPTLKELGALRAEERPAGDPAPAARRDPPGRAEHRVPQRDGQDPDADRLPGCRRVQRVVGRGRQAAHRGGETHRPRRGEVTAPGTPKGGAA